MVRRAAGRSLTIPATVNSNSVKAIVDTAAMITMVNKSIIELPMDNHQYERVLLKGIGPRPLVGQVVTDVDIVVGTKCVRWDVCVVDMTDSVILGLDFLNACNAVVDLPRMTVRLNGESIPAKFVDGDNSGTRVRLTKTIRIPANSSMFVYGKVDEPTWDGYIVEPTRSQLPVLVSSTIGNGPTCVLHVINDSNHRVRLKQGSVVGYADSIEGAVDIEDQEEPSVLDVKKVTTPTESTTESKSQVLPPHLIDLYERSIKGLADKQKKILKSLLIEYEDVFSKHDLDLGCLTEVKHKIDTKDAPPVKHRIRRTPVGFQDVEQEYLTKLLKTGVIQESTSEWASAPVLVRKRDGSVRWCVDYRALNDRTVKDCFPLPIIEDCLDSLQGSTMFCTLDLASGYYQIELDEADRKKTAFITRYGLFEHTRMGMGLCNAPATFQRAMQLVLRGLTWSQVLVYLDDVVVLGRDFDNSIDNLRNALTRFRKFSLKLKPKKCQLFQHEVEFLGKLVSAEGIKVSPSKVEAVLKWPVPTTRKELMSFLGFVNYHRDHVPNFAEVTAVLYELAHQEDTASWENRHEEAFMRTKQLLTSPPCLSYPNPDDIFILDTDASDTAIGAVLSQVQDGQEKVICYASHVLMKAQRKYCTTRKELLAVVKFCRHFRHYLLGRRFILRTDHNSLVWLMRFKHIEGQLARWLEELAQFDMQIVHRPGRKHSNADGVSRIPDHVKECDCYQAGAAVEDLPCNGCNYCQRAHKQWTRFQQDVDDVVPLSSKVISTLQVRRAISEKSEGTESHIISDDSSEDDCDEDAVEDLQDPDATIPYVEDGEMAPNWTASYSATELRSLQIEDNDICPIIEWLETEYQPTKSELRLQSPATRSFWMCQGCLEFHDGVLYYRWIDQPERGPCLLVPKSLRERVLLGCHDFKTAGHLGRQKTLARLKSSFIWYHMADECKQYVRSCSTCNQNKKANIKAKARLQPFHAGSPMERIHLDILGPFNVSESGNRYILMMVDQFTKWVEMAALPDQSALLIAQKFLVHFIATFGCPLEVHTDQGKNFDGTLFSSLCDLLEIAKTRTTPYHPSSNGQVERFNTVVLQMVRCYIEKKNRLWDRDLPLLAMALHSMVNRQTGYTPNKLMFGRETVQPIQLVLGTAQDLFRKYDPDSWIGELAQSLQEIHQLARERLRVSQMRQRRDYDLRLVEKQYSPGDLVYKIDSSTKIGHSKKLRCPWIGPYLVIAAKFPLYRIQNRKGDSVIHHDRLKPCEDRAIPIWLRRLRHQFFGQEDQEFDTDESTIPDIDPDETIPYVETTLRDSAVAGALPELFVDEDVTLLPGSPGHVSTIADSKSSVGFSGNQGTVSPTERPNPDVTPLLKSRKNKEGAVSFPCSDTEIIKGVTPSRDTDVPDQGPVASANDAIHTRRGRPVRKPLRFQD